MKNNEVFLKHIVDELDFIIKECKNLDFTELVENAVLKRAIARSLEIIGEAVKNISKDFKNEHTEIDWKKVTGLRDKLIHQYFGIDWNIVWDVIENKIPELREKIAKLIREK